MGATVFRGEWGLEGEGITAVVKQKTGYKFVLNQWIFGENGVGMNIAEIKTARDKAALQILNILQDLEKTTGMVVSYVEVENNNDSEGRNIGVSSSHIQLELE